VGTFFHYSDDTITSSVC